MSEFLRTLPDGRVFVDYGPVSMVITARRQGTPLPELAEAAFPLIEASLAEIAGCGCLPAREISPSWRGCPG